MRGDALLAKLDRTQHFANAFRVNYVLRIFSGRFRNELTRELPAARAHFAFEITYAGLASVMTNHFENAFVRKIKLFDLQAIGFSLFRHQMPLRDLEFFSFRVAGEP